VRVAFLGPAGTFSEEALAAAGPAGAEPVPVATLRDAVLAVAEGRADRALVPIENALEGSVDQTLDALAELAPAVAICGEHVHPIRTALVAVADGDIELVLSHPQPLGQCAGFLRRELPHAATRAAASTAEAVREVVAHGPGWAALAPRAAADAHGALVLREAVDDDPHNVTRFVWVAPAEAAEDEVGGRGWRTTVVFDGGHGDAEAGWLVACLEEFARRGVNLTRIESRPLRTTLGHYRFFADLTGAGGPVAEAVEALRPRCDDVKVLGSYRAASPGSG
jgi:prephenate dehydratase